MAVVPWEVVETSTSGRHVKLVVWRNLQALDTGRPFVVAEYSDKTVQIDGNTLGSGITIQGSLDITELTSTDGSAVGAGWDTLADPQGNPLLAITSEKIENVLEHCYLMRPSCSAGVADATVFALLASVR